MSFSLAGVLRRHARERPERPAMSFEGLTRTFAEVHERASKIANALAAEGVKKGDRVAVLSKNCPEYFEVAFACSMLGAITVGVNFRLASAEVAGILDDAQPSFIVVGASERALLPVETKRVVEIGPELEAWANAHSSADPGHEGAPDDVALILYTSGTTGQPKGVMISNRGQSFITRMAAEIWKMSADSVNLVPSPLFHIGGIGYGSSTLTQGGHTVLMREVDAAKMIEAMAKHRVTHTFMVPSVLRMLLGAPTLATADLSALELISYGAAPIGETLLRDAIAALHCKFMHVYGMTETSGTVTALLPVEHPLDGSERLRSCGRALPWVSARVVDPATEKDVPTRTTGEIWIRSEMVTPGYWNKPAESAAMLKNGGWLRTGDAAYADEGGYLYIVDRYKDMIVSGGENIYPAEVENVLGTHEAVLEAAVIGVPHERWGETVKAIVVCRAGTAPTAAELIEFCRTQIARYKCPTSIEFVAALPKSGAGKVLKPALRKMYDPTRQS